jgi:6-methylsalicylate decarboxylase
LPSFLSTPVSTLISRPNFPTPCKTEQAEIKKLSGKETAMLFCDHTRVTSCACHTPSRRGVLAALAGAGVFALGSGAQAQIDMPADQLAHLSPLERTSVPALQPVSQAVVRSVRRIDVHHHPVPPPYVEMVSKGPGLTAALRGWSVEKSLADMDRAGVETAMLSIPGNGLWLADAETNRQLARACNEYMAGIVQRYPGRFGMWAALPLTDNDSSLQEMAYALDTLHADGIGLLTVYGNKWLGDAAFAPVFAEFNRRRAVVYTHPATGTCCGNLISGVPDPVIEYGTDTARTIASLLFSGAAMRYPDVRMIFSHAGGVMPTLIERFVLLSRQPNMAKNTPDGALPLLARYYYDCAQSANPEALGPLMRIVPSSQIVFGTDFPYRTSLEHVAGLSGCGLSSAQLTAIGRTNALRLVPRLG